MTKKKVRLTNYFVIYILTGIIYIFMEVFATSIPLTFEKGRPLLSSGMMNKYSFNPIGKSTFDKMRCKPCNDSVDATDDYFKVSNLSLIGASSLWMFLLGGLCGLLLYIIYQVLIFNNRKLLNFNLFFASILGAFVITMLEFIVGVILNCMLHLYIWDYTNSFLNIKGQICFAHTFVYFILVCPVAYWFFDFLEEQYKDIKRPVSLFLYYRFLFNPFSHNMRDMNEHLKVKTYGK